MCGEIQTGIHQKDAHAEVFAVVAYDTRVSISRTKEQTAEHMPLLVAGHGWDREA